jgi:hypothetical protein
MDVQTFPYDDRYSPPAPRVNLELRRIGRTNPTVQLGALLDSGSDATLLPESYLVQIGARLVGQARVRGLFDETHLAPIYIVSVSIGEITLQGVRIVAMPEMVEPIVGRDILNALIVTMNGPAQVTEIVNQVR